MDIVLELCDTFVFDWLYAAALPGPAQDNAWSSTKIGNATTSSFFSMRESDTAFPRWQYNPATQYFSIEPSQYAYMSQLPRDSVYRQAISLFLTTWCVRLRTWLIDELLLLTYNPGSLV